MTAIEGARFKLEAFSITYDILKRKHSISAVFTDASNGQNILVPTEHLLQKANFYIPDANTQVLEDIGPEKAREAFNAAFAFGLAFKTGRASALHTYGPETPTTPQVIIR